MWEFSLVCDNKNKQIIEYINNCFCANLPDCMLTTYQDNNFTYLLFACDDNIGTICKSKIKKCIKTYIIDIYKIMKVKNKSSFIKNKGIIVNTE